LLGVGGGFVLIPLLTATQVPIREAVATSLLYVVFVAAAGAWSHLREGTVDWVLAATLAGGAIPAAPLGSLAAHHLPADLLEVVFGGLALAACAGLFLRRGPRHGEHPDGLPAGPARAYIVWRRHRYGGSEHVFPVDLLRGVLLGVGIGFISGLLGLGGGWLLVPLLVLVMGIPVPVAVGTSLVAILAPALTGAAVHYRLGNLDPGRAVPLVLAGIVGARGGAWGVVHVPERHLKRTLVGLLLLGGGYMLARGLGVLDP
ncbi:MAG TPA: sulfite exporter TauE/SafE family protein, partial [Candidatus Methylomirabilis sp.]|nr:sulfite exporter TauE/SafE family protein [Candidatus Methylomirabilis sp.]